MKLQPKRLGALALAMAGVTALLSGCGGGGGDATPVPTTTPFSTTVIDGAIKNAIVCLDKNANGACDADEPQGKTDAAGKVTFDVANDDLGKFPVLAIVGTDAVDLDTGPVMVAYTMSAPADKAAVVSPLTTLVQQVIVDTGASSAEAAKSVQDLAGLRVSLFDDFTKQPAPTDGTLNPATFARMVIVTTQQQMSAVASAVGTAAADGSIITKADVDRAVKRKLLERIPALLTALSSSAVQAAATPAAREAALLAAATTLATDSSALTVAALPTAVAINHQIAAPAPVTAHVSSTYFTLANLTFTDASNYFARFFTATTTQDTPDANNNVKYVDRRYRSNSGFLAKWGIGSDPKRQADLSWNGTAWVGCPLNFESTSTLRDAKGNSTYNYCDNRETGRNSSAVFDIAGKTMKEVYESVIAAGYTNFNIANASSALGSVTFPAASKLRYTTGTSLTTAISYYPAGKNNPVGVSNVVNQYSPAVAAGGVASSQAAGTGCNSPENNTNGTASTTLEGMIAAKPGSPCVFTGGSFVYQNVTYTNPDAANEQWGPQTLSLGTLGSAPVGSGPAPGFYTSNTRFRVAFKGSGSYPTVYFACKERFNTGSARNCVQIGTGTYSIATLGDARVMTFDNLPAQMAPLTFNQVYVERSGVVYYGYQNKLSVFNNARLNFVAGTALLTQLGMPLEDPAAPVALTAGSYQGTYDVRDPVNSAPGGGTILTFNGNGTASCQNALTFAVNTCTLSFSNAATGAFTGVNGTSVFSGTLNFLSGAGSGTYSDPTSMPTTGNFVAYRR
jgi:hypothetical protein